MESTKIKTRGLRRKKSEPSINNIDEGCNILTGNYTGN